MNINEFFEWLRNECLYPDGSCYYRPEFLWFNKAHKYYEDLVMYQPTFESSFIWNDNSDIKTYHYWKIGFMLSPYSNTKEYPGLLYMKEMAIRGTAKEWAGKYSVEELNSTPVEFWFRETENSYTRVKITPFGKPGSNISNVRKFLIEYDN